jgi:hypothetical protein
MADVADGGSDAIVVGAGQNRVGIDLARYELAEIESLGEAKAMLFAEQFLSLLNLPIALRLTDHSNLNKRTTAMQDRAAILIIRAPLIAIKGVGGLKPLQPQLWLAPGLHSTSPVPC